MPEKKEPPRAAKQAERQHDISHRGDTAGSGGPAGAPGARDKGSIAGIAGTGGSSGAGAAEAVTRAVGEVSGIDPKTKPDAVSGTVADYKRGMNDGGNRGKTRGAASETIPNADDQPPDD